MLVRRVRIRADGAAIPRRRSDTRSPPTSSDLPPRVLPRPCSPHKMAVSRVHMDSPEKRRLATFGSAGSINHPDRKGFADGLRSSPSATRHSSLGDHKSLETEALADVSLLFTLQIRLHVAKITHKVNNIESVKSQP